MFPKASHSPSLVLLSNVTAESLALRLRTSHGLDAGTVPGFDTWRAELLDPGSPAWEAATETLCLVLHGPALFPAGVGEDFGSVLDGISAAVEEAKRHHPDRMLIVSTLDLPRAPAQPLAGPNLERRAAGRWRDILESLRVPVLDIEELAAEAGRENFYNAKTWYLGALPFSARGETRLAAEIARRGGILRGARRKCLVLDLDGTLWGGVIGEDGLDGILLSDHGIGAVYRDVQSVAKRLARQGVLLAIASKNDQEDALQPFREHPNAVLHEEDFVCVRANWLPKPQNVADIARELNIGMDSLVFIDDNPVERAAVRAGCPEVEVPEFPSDTAKLPAFMREVADRCFTAPRLDAEDAAKAGMYRAEALRTSARASCGSLDDYLASLEMKLDLHLLREDEAPRAAQLCAKTNQFNLTTRRYTEADLLAMLRKEACRIWIASLRDRYGDYGRIALAIAEISGTGDTKSALFDTFLMSCRAMGRGVEGAVLAWIEELLASEGVTTLNGRYVPTAKNGPVRDFWERMGYAENGELWSQKAPFPERRSFVCRNS